MLIESDRADRPYRIVGESGVPVASIYAPRKADARLISSAPQMLEALSDILHEVTHDIAGLPRDELLDVVSAVRELAEAAIAKATGDVT
jgi:hypothetical protein